MGQGAQWADWDVSCSDGGRQFGMRKRQYYDASAWVQRWDGDRRSIIGLTLRSSCTASLPRTRGNGHLNWRRMWGAVDAAVDAAGLCWPVAGVTAGTSW